MSTGDDWENAKADLRLAKPNPSLAAGDDQENIQADLSLN